MLNAVQVLVSCSSDFVIGRAQIGMADGELIAEFMFPLFLDSLNSALGMCMSQCSKFIVALYLDLSLGSCQ